MRSGKDPQHFNQRGRLQVLCIFPEPEVGEWIKPQCRLMFKCAPKNRSCKRQDLKKGARISRETSSRGLGFFSSFSFFQYFLRASGARELSKSVAGFGKPAPAAVS